MLFPLFVVAALAMAPGLLLAEGGALATWKGHTNEVYAVAFTPDGKQVLSASEDRTLKLWDAATGRVLATWTGHTGEVLAVAVTSDGKKAVSGGEDRTIRIWDVRRGSTLAVLDGGDDEIRAISLSPDGRTAAVVLHNGVLDLFDLETAARSARLLRGSTAHATDAAFSPDGTRLVTAHGDKTVRLWDVAARRQTAVWKGHRHKVISAAFSPDGTLVASGGFDNTVRLWDVESGKTVAAWKAHESYVYDVVFAPDGGSLLSAGADYSLRRWSVPDGKPLAVWKGHDGGIQQIALSPDGSLAATAGADNTVRVWRVKEGAPEVAASPAVVFDPHLPAGVDARAWLGEVLFFDNRLSGDNSRNCASCHIPEKAFADGRALSEGYPNTLYFRNTPTLLNSARQRHLYWDARFPGEDLPSLVRDHLSEAHFLGADGRLIVEKLRQAPDYVAAFQQVYLGEPTYDRVLDTLSEFVRTLVSGESPFDRYLRGDKRAIGGAARRGYALFQGRAGCAPCHAGPLFSDGRLHDRGVPENPDVLGDTLRRISFRRFMKILGVKEYRTLRADIGRKAATHQDADLRHFKTPSLLEVDRTAPYMHNGLFQTLDEAVAHENPALSPKERRDIAAFLKTLSSETPAPRSPILPEYGVLAARGGESEAPRDWPPSSEVKETDPETFPKLGPLGKVPVPADNPLTPEKVELGRLLFFEPALSGNGDSFCAACHEPGMGWGDGSDLAQGYSGTLHWRNSQTILNAAYYSKLNWDGSKESLEEQARGAITSNLVGNGDPMLVEERLAQSPQYVALFNKAFGVDRPHFEGVLKALASFQRAVPVSTDTPFDRYARGDEQALTGPAQRGLALFEGKAGCIRCHNGPLVTDQKFYATGVPRNPVFDEVPLRQVTVRYEHVLRGVGEAEFRAADSDPGLFFTTRRAEDVGKFRTPSLRELKHTAPYMHNGVLRTLEEVVDFYDGGGGNAVNKTSRLAALGLNPREKNDLVAFLESLSGEEIVIPYPLQPGYPTMEYTR